MKDTMDDLEQGDERKARNVGLVAEVVMRLLNY